RSASSRTTRCGCGSFSSPKTSSAGPDSSASPSKRARGNSNGCATDCYTNQAGSPATPAERSCGSRATGPGQDNSPQRSNACKRSQPQQADRAGAGAATDGHPRGNPASACPQTTAPTPAFRAKRPRSPAGQQPSRRQARHRPSERPFTAGQTLTANAETSRQLQDRGLEGPIPRFKVSAGIVRGTV